MFRSSYISLDFFPEVEMPVIVVFTKYDVLFNEHYHDCLHISSPSDRREEAANRANRAFSEFTKELEFPFVHHQFKFQRGKISRKIQHGKMHGNSKMMGVC